jgi:hypothetical protein
MGLPKLPVSGATSSVGFTTRLVTISAITPDGQTAITVDKAGVEARVPMLIQRSKGVLPAAGEQWIISQDISNTWSFAAIATTDPSTFKIPGSALVAGSVGPLQLAPGTAQPPITPGSIPGTDLVPGSVTGAEIAAQAISSLNLAMAAAATNIILDPAFTSSGINATRLADPATLSSWAIAPPGVTASGTALATFALMPSTLVPLYVNAGEQYYLSATITLSGGTATGGIQFVFNTGADLGPDLALAAGANTVAQLVTIPPGVTSAYVRLVVSGLSGGATATFTNPVCYITAGPNQLQTGSVTNAAIAAGAVTATSLAAGSVTANAIAANSVSASAIVANTITAAQIAAGIVIAGIINGTVVTGSTLQNSAVNPITSINPDGSISITNAAGVITFKIFPNGTHSWYTSAGVLASTLLPGGTFLVYSTPALGGLIYSSSPVAGIDTFGNPYPQGVSATAGSISGTALIPGSVPVGAVNFTARSIGGITTTVSLTAPAGAVAGDLWINTSAANALYQYSGSAWVLYQFGTGAIAANSITAAQIAANTITATQIAAGTITASQIAAGTITAAQLTAGIVVSGIVNATTIMGATLIADGSAGEVLVYSGTPASGNLIGAWSGSAATDSVGNPYPQGLMAQGLTLTNQSAAPPAVTGASSFYSSVAGRPFYVSSAGASAVMERSVVNLSQFTVGNTTTPTQISSPMTYSALEGNQSSEYEIEFIGVGTNYTGATAGTLNFALYIDGSNAGGQFTIGASAWASGRQFGYTVRFVLDILTAGSGGTALIHSVGWFYDQSDNRLPSNSLVGGSTSSASISFDTTSTHTIQAYAWWPTSAAVGQSLTTYRTKPGRRN